MMIQRKMFFALSRAREKDKIQSPHELSGRVSERGIRRSEVHSSWGLRIFSFSTLVTRRKTFLYFLPSLKLTIFPILLLERLFQNKK